jgi:phosphatidylserine decarboxylase
MFWVSLQYLLPQRLIGRIVYHISRCRWRWVKNPLIRWFTRQFNVNLAEAQRKRADDFGNFNEFFARSLVSGARVIAGGETTLVSPADGRLTEFGSLFAGQMVQAKGMHYSLSQLLDSDPTHLAPFTDGQYATIYLAPNDYHRVHMPLSGTLLRTEYIPGRRFSVNETSAGVIRNLFCRNERVVCWFDGAPGPFALVLVGALNVSSISTAWLGEIASGARRSWAHAGETRRFARGEEFARFNLGSTVIMLFPSDTVVFSDRLAGGASLQMGRAMGRLGDRDKNQPLLTGQDLEQVRELAGAGSDAAVAVSTRSDAATPVAGDGSPS